MTEEIARIMSEREARLRRAFLDDDYGDADRSLSSSERSVVSDRKALLRNVAVAGWASNRLGRQVKPYEVDFQGVKQGLARRYFKLPPGEVSDEQIFDLIKSDYQAQEGALKGAENAALRGLPLVDSLGEWTKKQEGQKGVRSRLYKYQSEYQAAYSELAPKVAQYRGLIDEIASGLQAQMDAAAEAKQGIQFRPIADKLLAVPPEDRNIVIAAIGATGAASPDAAQSLWIDVLRNVGRGYEQLSGGAEGTGRRLSVGMAGGGEDALYISPEDAEIYRQERERVTQYENLVSDIRRVANGEVSPIKRDTWMGRALVGVGGSIPQTAAAFIPYAGPAMIAAKFREDNLTRLRAENPTMSQQDAEMIATFAAPIQTFASVTADRLMAGRMPNLSRLVRAPVLTGRGAATRFGVQWGLATAAEQIEENVQDVAPLAVQQIAAALDKDIPGPNWREYTKGLWDANKEIFGPAMLMSLVGAGGVTLADLRSSRGLAGDRDLLIASNYSADKADAIVEAFQAGDFRKAEGIMRSTWNDKPVPIEERQAAAERYIKKTNTASSQFQEQTREAGVSITKTAKGWEVSAGAGSVAFDRHEDAMAAAAAQMQAQEIETDERTLEAFEAFSQQAKEGESFSISPRAMSLFDVEAEAKQRGDQDTVDAIWKRLELEQERVGGQEMGLADLNVLGENVVEFKEGVKTYASRIFEGGRAVDLVEEKAEGDVKRWLDAGRVTYASLAEMIRAVEAATGDSYLVNESEAGVIEAYSDLARLYATGTRKGNRVSGAVRGQEAGIVRKQRANLRAAEKDGKAAPIIQKLKETLEFFKAVLRQAAKLMKAKKEGKLGDIEQFLNESVGLTEEVAHVEGVQKEALKIAGPTFSLRPMSQAEEAAQSTGSPQGGLTEAEVLKAGDIAIDGYGPDKVIEWLRGEGYSDGKIYNLATNAERRLFKQLEEAGWFSMSREESRPFRRHSEARGMWQEVQSKTESAYWRERIPGYGDLRTTMVDGVFSGRIGADIRPYIIYRGEQSVPAIASMSLETGGASNVSASEYPFISVKLANDSEALFQIRVSDHDQVSSRAPRQYSIDLRTSRKKGERQTSYDQRVIESARPQIEERIKETWESQREIIQKETPGSVSEAEGVESGKVAGSDSANSPSSVNPDFEDSRTGGGASFSVTTRDRLEPTFSVRVKWATDEGNQRSGVIVGRNSAFYKVRTDEGEVLNVRPNRVVIDRSSKKEESRGAQEDTPSFSVTTRDRLEAISAALGKQLKAAKPEARRAIMQRAFDRANEEKADWMELRKTGRKGTKEELEKQRQKLKDYIARRDAAGLPVKDFVRKFAETPVSDERAQKAYDKAREQAAMRTIDAVLSVIPRDARPFGFIHRKVAGLETDAARAKAIEEYFQKLEPALEKYFSEQILTDIDKLLDRAAPTKGENRVQVSKVGAEAQRAIQQILEVKDLDKDKLAEVITDLEGRMERADTPEALLDAVSLWGIANTFGALETRTAAELANALETLEKIYSDGRAKWTAVLEDFRASTAQAIQDGIKDLGNKAPADDAEIAAMLTQQQQRPTAFYLSGFAQEHLSLELFLAKVFGANSATAKKFADLFYKSTNAYSDAIQKRRDEFQQALSAAWGIKGLDKTRKFNRVLERLSKVKKDSGVFRTFGRITEERTMEIEQAERVLSDPAAAKALGLEAAEVLKIEESFMEAGDRSRVVRWEKVIHAGEQKEQAVSQLHAVQYLLSWAQPDVRERMEKQGWSEESVQSLRDMLSGEALAVMAFLQKEYADGYQRLNPVYQRMYGMDLPRVQNYARTLYRVSSQQGEADPFSGSTDTAGLAAGFIKTRNQRHNAALRQVGALEAYWSHVAQGEYWIAFAENLRLARAVLGDVRITDTVKAKQGEYTSSNLGRWLDSLNRNGQRKANDLLGTSRLLSNLQRAYVGQALGFKVGVLMKQASAAVGSLLEIPARHWAPLYWKLITGQIKLGTIFKSQTIQRRLANGFSPEVRAAMAKDGLNTGRFVELIDKSLMPIGYVDAAFTTISAGIAYEYHRQQAEAAGMTPDAAHDAAMEEMDRVIQRTAQPAETMNRSLREIESQGAAKLLFMFATEARQKAAIDMMAWRDLVKGKNRGEAMRKIFVIHVLMPLITQTMANLYKDLFTTAGDEEDDDSNWEALDYLRAMALGPANGIFLVGQGISTAFGGLTGKPAFETSNNPLDAAAAEMSKKLRRAEPFNTEDAATITKDARDYLQSAGNAGALFGRYGTGAAGVLLNPVSDAVGFVQNAADD